MLKNRFRLTMLAAAGAAVMLAGCGEKASAPAEAEKTADKAEAAPVVIYSNADEEAQQAMKKALDENGFKGKYLMQGFGTSELGGKLVVVVDEPGPVGLVDAVLHRHPQVLQLPGEQGGRHQPGTGEVVHRVLPGVLLGQGGPGLLRLQLEGGDHQGEPDLLGHGDADAIDPLALHGGGHKTALNSGRKRVCYVKGNDYEI